MGSRLNKHEIFTPIFPTPTAGNGEYDGKPMDTDGEATLPLYRCKQCGFPCDENEVQSPGGDSDGFGNISITTSDGVGDFTVKSGCPFCGSLNSRA